MTASRTFLLFIMLSLTGWPASAEAQDVKAYAVGTNFSADNKIVELTVPPELDGERFVIVWNSGNNQSLSWRVARSGTHSYEMRHFPNWKGPISVVATTLQAAGRVKEPDLSDEIDMFLEPERMTPSTINGLIGHTVFAFSWDLVLLVVFVGSSLIIAIWKKKKLALAAIAGFALAWALMDARSIYDDAVMISKGYRSTGIQKFADRAADIVDHQTWGSAPLDSGMEGALDYRLAESQYVPGGLAKHPDFWITTDPAGTQVLLQFANYYLVKTLP